jgi:hypothetical protein
MASWVLLDVVVLMSCPTPPAAGDPARPKTPKHYLPGRERWRKALSPCPASSAQRCTTFRLRSALPGVKRMRALLSDRTETSPVPVAITGCKLSAPRAIDAQDALRTQTVSSRGLRYPGFWTVSSGYAAPSKPGETEPSAGELSTTDSIQAIF